MDWIYRDLRHFVDPPWVELLLALSATAAGAMVGSEREQSDKPAGLRTLILVCLGSAVFTMVSFSFNTTTDDSGRVAAQIVTGIGFLGAGVILHSRFGVTGVTTAATIWVTAAVGMAAGAGYPVGALALSGLVRLVLGGILEWENQHLGGMRPVDVELDLDPDHGRTRFRLEALCDQFQCVRHLRFEPMSSATATLLQARVTCHLPRRQSYAFLNALTALEGLREIRVLDQPQ